MLLSGFRKCHLIGLCGFLVLLSGCKKEQAPQSHAPSVGVVYVKREIVPFSVDAPARVFGNKEVEIRPQASGILKERRFNEGQMVNKGDSLFLIDPVPYQNAVKKADGGVKQAEANQKKAARDCLRMKKLFKEGAVSIKDRDDALSALDAAVAQLHVAEAALADAKTNLEYTDVKSPISGIVGKERQSIGNLVSSGSSVLTSVIDINPLRVDFSISGRVWSEMLKMSEEGLISMPKASDLKVKILLPNGDVYENQGKVIFVDAKEDIITSTVAMKAEVQNSEKGNLLPGQFVRVELLDVVYNDPTVPVSCIISTSQGDMVYLVDKETKKVSVAPVKVRLVGNKAVIIEGVKEGDCLVYEGIVKVMPGSPVNPVVKEDNSENSPKK